jgi:hypothetical protein
MFSNFITRLPPQLGADNIYDVPVIRTVQTIERHGGVRASASTVFLTDRIHRKFPAHKSRHELIVGDCRPSCVLFPVAPKLIPIVTNQPNCVIRATFAFVLFTAPVASCSMAYRKHWLTGCGGDRGVDSLP